MARKWHGGGKRRKMKTGDIGSGIWRRQHQRRQKRENGGKRRMSFSDKAEKNGMAWRRRKRA